MNWHSFAEQHPQEEDKLIISNGNGVVAFAIWRSGLTNVMGLKGSLPKLSAFTHWISLEEMIEVL